MTIAEAAPPNTIKAIDELFRADRVALWATTYNVQLALFNEYLLRRLGDPPLNVTVLADRRCVNEALAAIPPERVDLVGPVNRRWLLRPVQMGTGRFHPKSYLAVSARSAKLLVGSGNLSSSGLDGGREVFTVFTAGSPLGDAAIATWRQWMRRLVGQANDVRLAERFADLEERLPKSTRLVVAADTPLWHNLDAPLADQLCDAIRARTDGVDELIVTAPFYDERGDALGRIAERLNPKTIRLYTATSTSVDGGRLVQRLRDVGATVEIYGYQPDRFTHAKLIGATSGAEGWLLSGSANLSHAALTLTAGGGNVELAVFTSLGSDLVRESFLPIDATAELLPFESLSLLSYDSAPESDQDQLQVAILSATSQPDGKAVIVVNQPMQPSWRLADLHGSQGLNPEGWRAETLGPLLGPIVFLVSDDGTIISNRVVLDDPEALARILNVGESTGSSRPAELTPSDLDSPLGEALLWLHQHMVMDVSEQTPSGGGGDSRDETESPEDDDLWTRLEQERLGRDPRAGIYRQFNRRDGSGEWGNPLVDLLDAMRARAPGEPHGAPSTPVIRLNPSEPKQRPGITWSTTARIRVRARNVLRRWASAQTDPRLSWVDPMAPLGNLRAIASVFVLLWKQFASVDGVAELSPEDLDDLWHRWFAPFVGTGKDDGWLDRLSLSPDQLARYADAEFVDNVTTLCWLSIRPDRDHRERIITWQPTLQAAFDRGLIDVTMRVSEDVDAMLGREVGADQIADDLLNCLTYIDDPLWCEQTAAGLGLHNLTLEAVESGQNVSVRLRVRGIDEPLYDPRVPNLILAAMRYRRTDSVALFSDDKPWRLVVAAGTPMAFRSASDESVHDSSVIESDTIDKLVAAQGVIADLFDAIPLSA